MPSVCTTCHTAYNMEAPRFGCACGAHAVAAPPRPFKMGSPMNLLGQRHDLGNLVPSCDADWPQVAAEIARRAQLRQWQRWGATAVPALAQ